MRGKAIRIFTSPFGANEAVEQSRESSHYSLTLDRDRVGEEALEHQQNDCWDKA